jgi:glycerol-3-phosphate acyltransferase PlsY
MQHDPEWIISTKESLMTPTAAQNAAAIASQPTYNNRTVIIRFVFRIATMILCLGMISTAFVGFSHMKAEATEVGRFFVAIYMLFFAGLLFCFEIIQLRRINYLEEVYRRNFGFMFTAYGKALYIIL